MVAKSLISDVQSRAQAALTASPFYELHAIRVQDQGHSLLISGTVTTFYQKQLAQEVVRSVCREIELMNTIDVEDGSVRVTTQP